MHAIHITDYAQKIGYSMSFGDIVEIYRDIRNKFHLEDRKNDGSGKEDAVTDNIQGFLLTGSRLTEDLETNPTDWYFQAQVTRWDYSSNYLSFLEEFRLQYGDKQHVLCLHIHGTFLGAYKQIGRRDVELRRREGVPLELWGFKNDGYYTGTLGLALDNVEAMRGEARGNAALKPDYFQSEMSLNLINILDRKLSEYASV